VRHLPDDNENIGVHVVGRGQVGRPVSVCFSLQF
jgi:hypothetical protein